MSVERIEQHFRDGAALALEALEALHLPVAAAVDAMFMALANGNRILAGGAGASAATARRLVAALVGGFERERPGLPALALGGEAPADAAAQVRALGQAGDVLLVIDPTGVSLAMLDAVQAAHERELHVIALTGAAGGALGAALADTDIVIGVPSERIARVEEIHLLIIHSLCDGIDAMLLGED
jgi:D-sedoheptulose 7-phosphate isomerase